jgi:hypothetical protein
MKIAAIALMTAALGVAAERKHPQREVTVYLRENAPVSPHVRVSALELAHKMFAKIGIRLDKRIGEPPRTAAKQHIGIELTTNNPPHVLPGALGSAMPFEGIHIKVFYDRIRGEVVPKSVLLAHVLVHEITHILQGTDQHSGSGIMKAVWTHQDHLQMLSGALPFTPQDVDMIHRGLAARASGVSPLATGDLDSAIAD